MPFLQSQLHEALEARHDAFISSGQWGPLSALESAVSDACESGAALTLDYEATSGLQEISGSDQVADVEAQQLLTGLSDAIGAMVWELSDDQSWPKGRWYREPHASLDEEYAGWHYRHAL